MKKVINCFLPMFLLLCCSCSIQQRLYRKGFYVPGISRKHLIHGKLMPEHGKEDKAGLAARADSLPDLALSDSSASQGFKEETILLEGKMFSDKSNHNKKVHYVPSDKRKTLKSSSPGLVEEIDFREEERIRNKAVLSLIFGICSIPLLFIYVGFIFAIIAIITGSNALKAAKKVPYKISGMGRAKAGLILGIVALGLVLIAAVGALVFLAIVFM